MTREDKQLLLQDLCERLPYRVMVHHPDYDEPECLDTVFTPDAWNEGGIMCTIDDHWDSPHDIRYCKPYLRPMSSMTEEEKNELKGYLDAEEVDCNGFGYSEGGTLEDYISSIPYSICAGVVDWLNKKMFDYRGLIPEGLAISTKDFNPYKD